MKEQKLYHGMTWSTMWIIHKEIVSRAMREIRNQIGKFTTYDKEVDYKEGADLVTTADYAAQQIYTDMIDECTPNAGIVAEENGLLKSPSNGETISYTIDPVDGTKALVRKQSDGIGTLFGVVDTASNDIIWSYVWDVMTQELYYYRPWSDKVHRLSLEDPTKNSILSYQNRDIKRILTLDDIRKYPERVDKITTPWWYRDNIGVSNGSIGTNMARLWKCEVDAVLLKSWTAMPWDRIPCAGISKRLWYLSICVYDDNTLEVKDMDNNRSLDAMKVPYQIIAHKDELKSILSILDKTGIR